MNIYHIKKTDLAESLKISTPLRLDTLDGVRFALVGDADPAPGAELFVVQYGYERWKPAQQIRRNTSMYMLRYVSAGKGSFCGTPISKGFCYLSIPGVEYQIISDTEDPLVHYWVAFEGSKAAELMHEVFGRIVPLADPYENCDAAIEVIDDILRGNFGKVNEHYYHISGLYNLFALHSPHPKPPANIHHHDFSMYLKAMEYIEAEYDKKITVNEIASRIHIVPSYLYRIFMKYAGISPQQMLMRKRMQMAVILLDQNCYSISQIAEMVGYSDVLQFSKIFKKHFSVSPTQYQKK